MDETNKKSITTTTILLLLLATLVTFGFTKAYYNTEPPSAVFVYIKSSFDETNNSLMNAASQLSDDLGYYFKSVSFIEGSMDQSAVYLLYDDKMTMIGAVADENELYEFMCDITESNIACDKVIKPELRLMDKPEVKLFVMSHCPYAIEMEKQLIPVLEQFGDDVEFDLNFVNYAMHGYEEVEEQMYQYCIQKEKKDLLLPYLKCFTTTGNKGYCLNLTEINVNEILLPCLREVEEATNTLKNAKNESTYVAGGYPAFLLDNAENEYYNVKGSPTFVLNGIVIEPERDSDILLTEICKGFNLETQPEVCNENV